MSPDPENNNASPEVAGEWSQQAVGPSPEWLNKGETGIAAWNDSRRGKREHVELRGLDLRAANLRGVNLSYAQLVDVRLRDADLRDADLQYLNARDCDLRGADLTGALLDGAELTRVDLEDAKLHRASLHGASLENVDRLTAEQLPGALLANAKLPDRMNFSSALDQVEHGAKAARAQHYIVLSGCAYSLLTAASTQDVQLLTNSTIVQLPIIETAVPVLSFYYYLPPLLIVAAISFYAQLFQTMRSIARLPAGFPDGTTLQQRIYPWPLILELTRRHGHRHGSAHNLTGARSSQLLTWWAVPLTLLIIWGRFQPCRGFAESAWVALCVAAAASISIYMRGSLDQEWRAKPAQQAFLGHRSSAVRRFLDGARNMLTRTPRASAMLCLSLTFSALLVLWGSSRLLPFTAFTVFELGSGLELPAEASSRPEDYYKLSQAELYRATRGINLYGKDLRGVRAKGSFLMRANLERAVLRKASLQWSNLESANLRRADLRMAKLHGAKLRFAHLEHALLQDAELSAYTRLMQRVQIHLADKIPKQSKVDAAAREFQEMFGLVGASPAELANAHLSHAHLERADLCSVDLRNATLQQAHLQGANLKLANLDGADLSGANLQEANLSSATLTRVQLPGADLTNANLEHANLDGVVLRERCYFPLSVSGERDLVDVAYGVSVSDVVAQLVTDGTVSADQEYTVTCIALNKVRMANTKIRRAVLRGLNFEEVDMRNADVSDAHFEKTKFIKARLRGLVARRTRFDRASLVAADLRGADLREAHFEHANMSEADLSGAKLEHAHFGETRLRNARLNGAKLEGARYSEGTEFPSEFDPASAGMVLVAR